MHQRSRSPAILLATALGLLAGCGGGGSAAPGPGAQGAGSVEVATYYDAPANTILAARGEVLVDASGNPTAAKVGSWTTWFPPAEGHGIATQRSYEAGVWDTSKPWCEWNADGSIRIDSGDH